jgi:cyclic-di-GMP-binding protein
MAPQPLTTTDALALRFADAATCRRWLESLPLTNAAHAQRELAGQLAALHVAANVAPIERLRILEVLKEALVFVQNEAAQVYAGKPLPLDNAEADAWARSMGLWQYLAKNYGLCLQAHREGDLVIAPYAALVTLRCLSCVAWMMHDHYSVYRQPAATLWRELNERYAYAEQHGYARIRVQDNFGQRDPDSSCAEVYVQALLTYLANPFSLSVRQSAFVRRWLEKWASLVSLAHQPLPPSQIPPLVVDLASSSGVRFSEGSEPASARYLDLEQLAKTLRQTINLLKQGQTPAQLGLGEDARQPGCENLLMLLYVQWCRAGTARAEDRLTTQQKSTVCFGISAAHYQASGGKHFRQPGELTAREKRDLDTFGYIARVDHEAGQPDDCGTETWLILNHSASGFMCMSRQPDGRARIAHNQLLAVRRESGKQFHLGMVQWVKIDGNEELQCGVRLFPGAPAAVAVRPSNFNPVGSSRYERALVLPEVPAPATPATIVLPAGWFQSGRFVEIFAERKQVAKLLNLLERGSDFDRGTIAIV